jgi:hypothetical protein
MDITKFTKSQHFEEVYERPHKTLSNYLSELLEKQLSENKFAEIHQVKTKRERNFTVIFNVYN